MKRLLLVSYYFPPLGGPGVFRPLRLAKYLPRNGWDVTVLTVSPRVRLLKDPQLLKEVPKEVTVAPTLTLEPRGLLLMLLKLGLSRWVNRLSPWLMIPDDQRGWVPFATRRGIRLLEQMPHDAILSTAAPYSTHLIGRILHRRSGLPWIADFRDEWTANPFFSDIYPTRWHLRFNQRLEGEILREADRVVTISDPCRDSLQSLAPERPASRFLSLPNGFDGEHFPKPLPPPPERFRVVYTGMFYGPRSPGPFLSALKQVVAQQLIPVADLEVVFVGHTAGTPELEGLPSGLVRVIEQRPYFEALDHLRQAAVLLLVVPRSGGPGNFTGKLFPYLAAGRPILCLAPEPNVAADLVRESRSGIVVPPDDPQAIAQGLVRLYRDWRAGTPLDARREEVIARFEASRQVQDWATLLNELTADRSTAR